MIKWDNLMVLGFFFINKINLVLVIVCKFIRYGCVNWINENFSFNDSVDRKLIWWEKEKIYDKSD